MASTTVQINIRMYHVGFGDCFLVTIDGPERQHRALIDCGTHAGTKRTDGDPTFRDIVAAIVADSGGHLDVVVATHRHRDHVHGFSYRDLWKDVTVGEVWMPWVENPRDPVAHGIRAEQDQAARVAFHALRSLSASLRAAGRSARAEEVDESIDIVYNSTSNAEAFAQLHGQDGFTAKGARLRYLPRSGYRPERLGQAELDAVLPHAVVHVLGPSHDPRVMKKLEPPSGKGYMQLLPADDAVPSDEVVPPELEVGTVPAPFGKGWVVDEKEYGFGRSRIGSLRQLYAGSLDSPLEMAYRIDNAVNGTSLVLLFEIGDVKLLFPGDAQWGTWEVILEDPVTSQLLDGLSFFKVGHHGSHNATPNELVQTKLDERTRVAMIPVAPTSYGGGWKEIPKDKLVDDLRLRTAVVRSDMAAADMPAGVTRTEHYTEITLVANVEDDKHEP